jgi:hypothetical protein
MPTAKDETELHNPRIPRWLMVAFGSASSIAFTGMLAWLTSMNLSIQDNAVEIAAIKAKIDNAESNLDDVKIGIKRLNEKVDSLLRAIIESKQQK